MKLSELCCFARMFSRRFRYSGFFAYMLSCGFLFGSAAAVASTACTSTCLGDTTASVSYNYPPSAFGVGSGICWKMVGEPAGGGWTVNGSTATSGLIPYRGGSLTVPIVTSGIGITPSTGSTTQSVQFFIWNTGAGGSCSSGTFTNYPLVVDPAISISKTSVSLVAPSSSNSATVTATINPIQNVNVTVTCTGANGPTFTYGTAQTQAINQSTGQATFVVNANSLVLAYPPTGQMSAYCVFQPSTPVAGSTPNSATLTFQTLSLTPTISINPTTISLDGTTSVTASMSNGQGLWAGVPMNGSCNQSTLPSGSSVSVVSPQNTNNSGQAIFPVTATNLVFVNSNTGAALPTPTCSFKWPTGSATTILNFTTANACAPSFGLVPRPPGCGGP